MANDLAEQFGGLREKRQPVCEVKFIDGEESNVK